MISVNERNQSNSINIDLIKNNDDILLTRYLNDMIDIYMYNNYDKFIQKYQINHNTYFTSKLHFLDSDQQMFIIHLFYKKLLPQKIVNWDNINILFQNELEYKLNKSLKNKEIYHTAITESFIVSIDTFKITKDSSLLSLAIANKSQQSFKDELQHKFYCSFIFSNLIDTAFLTDKVSYIDTNKIFKLERNKYSLYIFVYNDYTIIAINNILQIKPLEYLMIDKSFSSLTVNQFVNYCDTIMSKLNNRSLINTKQCKTFFNIIYNHLQKETNKYVR